MRGEIVELASWEEVLAAWGTASVPFLIPRKSRNATEGVPYSYRYLPLRA
jgi:hypothetical protein